MLDPRLTLEYAGNPRKQSRWGLASVAFSIAAVFAAVVGMALNARFGIHGDVLPLWLLASVGGCLFSLLAGFVSGIVGICQTRRRREAAMAGLAIAAMFLVSLVLWTGIRP